MFYILAPDDIIQVGDTYSTSNLESKLWMRCTNSVGYTVRGYGATLGAGCPWIVRRKITKTKLGNIID